MTAASVPTLSGNDFSHWQGDVRWAAAAAAAGFEMLKSTQGVTEQDAKYGAGIHALRLLGEPRGSYHYPNAGDPIAEADFYVLHTGRQAGELQALDCEGRVLELADPVGWAAAWLTRVITRTDNVPLIYMSGDTLTRFDWSRVIALGVGLWCAKWGAARPDHGQWPFAIMWQTSETGRLAGVDEPVDTDVFFGNAATWARYGANRHLPAPAPSPAPKPRPAPHPSAVHLVIAGDSLGSIAAATHTTVVQLVALNRRAHPSLVANPNHIEIGWRLVTQGTPATAPAPAPAPSYHQVAAGDSLGSIAAAAHTTVGTLLHLNPTITNPDHIEIGWRIRTR